MTRCRRELTHSVLVKSLHPNAPSTCLVPLRARSPRSVYLLTVPPDLARFQQFPRVDYTQDTWPPASRLSGPSVRTCPDSSHYCQGCHQMSSTVRSSEDWTDSDEDTAADSDVEIQLLEKTDAASRLPSKVSRPTLKLLHTIRCGRRLQWHSTGRAVVAAITPSFVRRQSAEQTNETKSNNGIPALDGLRGLACLFVINEHLTYNLTTTFLHGYGDDNLRSIIQLPFIRVFWSGFSMVAIFYVISGYVLSYKPLKQIRNRDMSSFQRTVTSSIFRRAARLYLPTTIAVLLCGIFTYLGAFRYSNYLFCKDDNYLNLHEPLPPTFDSLGPQMLDATKATLRMLNIWDWTDDLSAGDYDLHTWTIVVELRSSMILFLLLIGTSHLRQTFRLLTTSAFLLFCIITTRKDVLLFTSGMLLADIDLLLTSTQPTLLPSPTTQTSHHSRLTTHHAQHTWLLLFILGLYLASVPVFGVYTTPRLHHALAPLHTPRLGCRRMASLSRRHLNHMVIC